MYLPVLGATPVDAAVLPDVQLPILVPANQEVTGEGGIDAVLSCTSSACEEQKCTDCSCTVEETDQSKPSGCHYDGYDVLTWSPR